MNAHEFTWTPTDRAHEHQEEADDAFDAKLAEEAARQARAMLNNVTIGHKQTLSSVTESVAFRLGEHDDGSENDRLSNIIHAGFSCGALLAGQMLMELARSCIADDAETAALVEMGRESRAGGLDLAAMLRADINADPALRASINAMVAS